jgi:hypothetical protein
MKLAAELLLDQLSTQCLPGCDHAGEALGAPFLDTGLHPMRANRGDEPGASRRPGAGCTQPPPRIQNADPLHAEVLQGG